MIDIVRKAFASMLAICFMVLMLLTMTGCQEKTEEINDLFWEDFYAAHSPDEAVVLDDNYDINQASYGYLVKREQGYNGWYYGKYTAGVYHSAELKNGGWVAGNASLSDAWITSANSHSGARKYVNSRADGKVWINGTLKGDGNPGTVRLEIFNNQNQILETADIDCKDTIGIYYEVEVELNQGDELIFALIGEGCAHVNPMIVYNHAELVLRAQNQSGYWGDLMPYYNEEDGLMYMYYMTGDTSDLANPKIDLHLATSEDLFNFTEEEYEIKDCVERIVQLNIFDVPGSEMLDMETFPDGYRDTYRFFDEQIQRYRYVALSYYSRSGVIKCALSTGVSDDAEGLSWTQPAKILVNFPIFKQPECPWAMWINDRWYIGCSLWGTSDHNVGRCRYYIGDEGKGIDEQDWLNKEAHYIDGEDLCASQIIDVGGRYLMYGWIIMCYEDAYFPRTIDNGLWGGEMNVMREVYQLEDGTLGTRLPDTLKKMLCKGLVKSGENLTLESNSAELTGDFGSSYITYRADLTQASSVTATLISDGKEYEIILSKNEGKTNLQIMCKEDTTHPLAASYEIDADLDECNVIIISEGNVLEVFVNDKYALSARTSMFSGRFQKMTIAVEGTAKIVDWKICKLANSLNVYE